MDPISFSLLLDYLYNNFAITFVFSLIGVSVGQIARNVSKNNAIKIKRVIASAVFSTVVLCAANEYFKVSFSIYVLICMIVGIWSDRLLRLVTNSKFMTKFIMNLFKKIATPVTTAISETLEESEKEKSDKKKNTNKKDDPTG